MDERNSRVSQEGSRRTPMIARGLRVDVSATLLTLAISMVVAGAARACPGDLTGNGSVGVADLLGLLSCWGPTPSGPCLDADLTSSDSVGVADLLVLLANWGECPCVANCDGKECGDDGCGGSCGTCPPGTNCQDNLCVASNSCAAPGSCGGSAGACACDEICCIFEDCCIDKVAVCGGCSPSGPGPNSCLGHCGGNPGNCWCDEDCCIFNDCCDDKQFVCGGCSP